MFCEQCGKPVSDYAKYCRHCGTKLEYYKLAREQLAQQATPPEAAAGSGEGADDADAPIADDPSVPAAQTDRAEAYAFAETFEPTTLPGGFVPPVPVQMQTAAQPRPTGVIVLATACLMAAGLICAGLWFWLFGAQHKLKAELDRDWTQVHTQEDVVYVVHLKFDDGTMSCYYEAGTYKEQVDCWDYEIISDDQIALLDDSGTVITVSFNDNRNRMTLSPGCLNGGDTEHWFNFDT